MKMILATVTATALLVTSAMAGVVIKSTINEHNIMTKQEWVQDSGAVEVTYEMDNFAECFAHNEYRFMSGHKSKFNLVTNKWETETVLTDADRAKLTDACNASL